jgi:hypothetical protein
MVRRKRSPAGPGSVEHRRSTALHLSPHEQVRLLLSCISTVCVDGTEAGAATGADAVRLPLPGGWVTTAWGDELHRVVSAGATLAGAPGSMSA